MRDQMPARSNAELAVPATCPLPGVMLQLLLLLQQLELLEPALEAHYKLSVA
jgi:hypothetical protein